MRTTYSNPFSIFADPNGPDWLHQDSPDNEEDAVREFYLKKEGKHFFWKGSPFQKESLKIGWSSLRWHLAKEPIKECDLC